MYQSPASIDPNLEVSVDDVAREMRNETIQLIDVREQRLTHRSRAQELDGRVERTWTAEKQIRLA